MKQTPSPTAPLRVDLRLIGGLHLADRGRVGRALGNSFFQIDDGQARLGLGNSRHGGQGDGGHGRKSERRGFEHGLHQN